MLAVSDQEVYEAFSRSPWPHQFEGVKRVLKELETRNSLCLASPTGSGKTMLQAALIRLAMTRKKGVIVYNARRPLNNQLSRTLDEADIHHGARAASMKSKQNLHALIQCGSIQTDIQRVVRQKVWDIHRCDLVIVDEAHIPQAKSEMAQQLLQQYLASGAKVLGMTGTPLGVNHIYSKCIDLVSNSTLRKCGAHVPAKTYCIHEMDTSKLKPVATGEYREGDVIKKCWSPSIVGYAFDDWKRLNPDGKTTIAGCPGVDESVWVANQWLEKGLRVAHIDAKECIVNGERYRNDAEGKVREQVLEDARKGEFELITNCEVLMAGIDIPNIYHAIMLRPYGSLANYIQFGGRAIRSSPETADHVIIQDHVGNAVRWGSINQDRDWAQLFDKTEQEVYADRMAELQNYEEGSGKDPEPIVCIKCGKVRASGPRCPECNAVSDRRQRVIVQQDGQLREIEGRVYKKPPQKKRQEVSPQQKQWDSIYFASKNSKSPRAMTFKQAANMYARKYGEYPPFNLKKMPKEKSAWNKKIRETEWHELT